MLYEHASAQSGQIYVYNVPNSHMPPDQGAEDALSRAAKLNDNG